MCQESIESYIIEPQIPPAGRLKYGFSAYNAVALRAKKYIYVVIQSAYFIKYGRVANCPRKVPKKWYLEEE